MLVERLYGVAKGRQDRALMSETLKQLFALPPSATADALLRRLAEESATSGAGLLAHPAIQLHLLRKLLQCNDSTQALNCWRRLSRSGQLPAPLPGLTLQLAKQMGQKGDLQAVRELSRFLRQHYPEADPTRQLTIYQQHLAP